jgi:hypothetical protein
MRLDREPAVGRLNVVGSTHSLGLSCKCDTVFLAGDVFDNRVREGQIEHAISERQMASVGDYPLKASVGVVGLREIYDHDARQRLEEIPVIGRAADVDNARAFRNRKCLREPAEAAAAEVAADWLMQARDAECDGW